jgi:hypothetical protein
MKTTRPEGGDEELPKAKEARLEPDPDPVLTHDNFTDIGRHAPDFRTWLTLCGLCWPIRRRVYSVRRLVAWLSPKQRQRDKPPAGLDLGWVFGIDNFSVRLLEVWTAL